MNVALLYRRITSIATITVSLWVGTLLTTLAVIATGALHFDRHIAFDFPPGAFNFSLGFVLGLGAASRIGVYDYLGTTTSVTSATKSRIQAVSSHAPSCSARWRSP